MKKEEFIKYLNKLPDGLYVMRLKYKYDFETVYDVSIEVCEISYPNIVWFNDWDEGQQDVEIGIIVNLEKLITSIKKGI